MSIIQLVHDLSICFIICITVIIICVDFFKPILYYLVFEDYHLLEDKKNKIVRKE